jgi:predicted transcriptional regulator
MSAITVSISDEHLFKLHELADRFKVSTETLVQISIDELLSKPDADFHRAADYVLKKNAELYKRLS